MSLVPERFQFLLRAAYTAAKKSDCGRRYVGCVLASDKGYPIVYASNVSLMGGCQRPSEKGNCGCVHAEVNAALTLANIGAKPYFAFLTAAACEMCAKALVKVGVKHVVYVEESWPQEAGFAVFNFHGITYEKAAPPIGGEQLTQPHS